jgi:hypothetical protein
MLFNSCKDKAKPATDEVKPVGEQTYSDSSSSSVRVYNENGKVCIQQSNTYYELTDAYEDTIRIPLLLKIKKTELCYADSTNKHKVYEISAKSVAGKKSISWNMQFVATDVQFNDNTLLATHEGVDSEEDFMRRFSLLDGKEVFSASYEVKAKIPNVRDKFFIGYTSKQAATSPLKELNTENLLAVLHYGSSSAAGNGLKIVLKRSKVSDKIPTYSPEMVLVAANENATVIEDGKSLILMKLDEHYQKADIKDFALKLSYTYGDDNESTVITIPVTAGQLDLKGAKYDKEIFDIQPL